jgi:prefoldin beta subunit
MNEEEKRAAIVEFERNRQLLAGVSAQKQQLSFQKEVMQASIDELKKTKEDSVFKVVGNILVKKGRKEMEDELTERKESVELRLKTLQKQEEAALKKLNSIRAEMEKEEKKKEEAKEEKPPSKKKAGK